MVKSIPDLQGFEWAGIQCAKTPGYVCSDEIHEKLFKGRDEMLKRIEDNIMEGFREAGPLFNARDSLRDTHRQLRRREMINIAVRTAVRFTFGYISLCPAYG